MTTVQIFLNDIWDKTLAALYETRRFDDSIFNNFFKNDTKLISLDKGIATIEVPHIINREIIKTEKDTILTTLKSNCDQVQDLVIVLPNEIEKNTPIETTISLPTITNNILSSFTFDNFVVGPSNKESHSAALGCAYSPGKLYNPLFIFGNSGLGKTHLLNAIGNYCLKNHPDLQISCISCSDFVDKVGQTIRSNTISQFKQEMSQLDVLLIDDIQFLAGGKEKSSEVFFQIYNSLISNKKQVVITSDRHPTEISGLQDRLISRFNSGLSVSVTSPAYDTSRAILKQKIKNHSFDAELIDDDVIDYLASNFSRDIRKLEGALNRLLFYGINFEQADRITLDTAINAFKGHYNDKDVSELSISKIKRVVCDYFGITRSQLISKARTRQIATARHVAIYLSRRHLDLSFQKIGEEFGKRDHSTIINSCEKVEKLKKTDKMFIQSLSEVEKQLIS